ETHRQHSANLRRLGPEYDAAEKDLQAAHREPAGRRAAVRQHWPRHLCAAAVAALQRGLTSASRGCLHDHSWTIGSGQDSVCHLVVGSTTGDEVTNTVLTAPDRPGMVMQA